MKVKLTYFKESGKYYSEGEYETNKVHFFEIVEEVRVMKNKLELPGLVRGADKIVLLRVPEHPHDHPCLLLTDERN